MKHLVATVLLVVAIALGAGIVSFRLATKPDIAAVLEKRDPLTWLKTDFKLTDAQFTAIRTLHESYSKVCEEHCRAIQEAAIAKNAVAKAPNADAAAVRAAERRLEELRTICETAIAGHVREVAAHMSPQEGARYLALVLPKIPDFDHRAAPDVGVNVHASHH